MSRFQFPTLLTSLSLNLAREKDSEGKVGDRLPPLLSSDWLSYHQRA